MLVLGRPGVWKRALFVIVLMVAFAVPVGCWTRTLDVRFTPQRWKNCEERDRFRLTESLKEQYDLVGMSEAQVEELLGPGRVAGGVPDDGHMYEEYRIKDDLLGGWRVLLFEYNKGVVVDVRESWEDW